MELRRSGFSGGSGEGPRAGVSRRCRRIEISGSDGAGPEPDGSVPGVGGPDFSGGTSRVARLRWLRRGAAVRCRRIEISGLNGVGLEPDGSAGVGGPRIGGGTPRVGAARRAADRRRCIEMGGSESGRGRRMALRRALAGRVPPVRTPAVRFRARSRGAEVGRPVRRTTPPVGVSDSGSGAGVRWPRSAVRGRPAGSAEPGWGVGVRRPRIGGPAIRRWDSAGRCAARRAADRCRRVEMSGSESGRGRRMARRRALAGRVPPRRTPPVRLRRGAVGPKSAGRPAGPLRRSESAIRDPVPGSGPDRRFGIGAGVRRSESAVRDPGPGSVGPRRRLGIGRRDQRGPIGESRSAGRGSVGRGQTRAACSRGRRSSSVAARRRRTDLHQRTIGEAMAMEE